MTYLPQQNPYTVAPFPTSWAPVRYASNPVINVADNPNETDAQYTPAPIQLSNGDIWVYVKGTFAIYAWKSTDGGVTFSLQNSNNPVVSPGGAGTWDHFCTLEPFAVYDEANATIHLYYGGASSSGQTDYGWGHATASDSNPASFTKDVANPILSNAAVSSALGGGTVSDLKVGSVIKIGSTWHFYGNADYNGLYKLIHLTGTTWNNPTSLSVLLTAPGGWQTVVQTPSVFSYGNVYGMLYTLGGPQNNTVALSLPRSIFPAFSSDGVNWQFDGSAILSIVGDGWEQLQVYAGHLLLSSAAPFSAPVVDAAGRWHLYYSGLNLSGDANSGLCYLTPS